MSNRTRQNRERGTGRQQKAVSKESSKQDRQAAELAEKQRQARIDADNAKRDAETERRRQQRLRER